MFKHSEDIVSAGFLDTDMLSGWCYRSNIIEKCILKVSLGEKLRERLEHLEALAASKQSLAIDAPPTNTFPAHNVVTCSSSSTISHINAQSFQDQNTSDVSISGSSDATPEVYQHLVPHSHREVSPLSKWDSTTHVNPSLLIRDKGNDSFYPYWTTTINCSCSTAHVQLGSQGPGPFDYGKVRILSFGHRPVTADPYVNNIRVEALCIVAAMQALGMCIGINEETLCADESTSPFFRFSAVSADCVATENTVQTVQSLFRTLKPNMRPSSEQITIQHPSYMDILPFPTLRKNLIQNQDKFDEDEFLEDMTTGLVCWGRSGLGKKERNVSTGSASNGTPWDVRSWEAKASFLRKYWDFLGGEEGELVQQSEWWRNIRGDDDIVIGTE
jgi:hypothetical protein